MKQRNAFELILWSSCLAMFAVGANSTAIMAALPSMTTELSLSLAGVEWAVNSYLLVSASFIVLGGQAADRFGARLVSLVGLALFAVGSCRIAIAGTEAALLTGRALQGFAAAFAVPSTLAGVNTNAPSARQAAAVGAWTGLPNAWLQHGAAARRRAHAHHRLARDFLARRPTHVDRHCRCGVRDFADRPCPGRAESAR